MHHPPLPSSFQASSLPRNLNATASPTTPSGDILVGWTNQGADRGTWDIITSSLFTILICTWTVIHPRVHAERRLRNAHKMCQLVKMLLAPEMVCLESLQEWIQARKMIKRCADATGGGLCMVHAYYSTMLAIRYHHGPAGYRTLWPAQLAWLLNNGLVRWVDRGAWGLADEEINDKSKADGLVKLAALCQVTWFSLQCVMRTIHGLAIAPLEVMTIAYVVVMVITYFFWWLKPKDIAAPTFVRLPAMSPEQWILFESLSMENTYDMQYPGAPYSLNIAWYLVARDCQDDEVLVARRPEMAQVPAVQVPAFQVPAVQVSVVQVQTTAPDIRDKTREFIQPKSTVSKIQRAKPVHSVTPNVEGRASQDARIITEWDSALYMTKFWPFICLLGASFGAVHLIAWNSIFPSHMELWLWRASALVSTVTAILVMQFRKVSFQWEGPLTIVSVGSPILYVISRTIMSAQAFAALRALPASTYQTFEIWNYWFHFL